MQYQFDETVETEEQLRSLVGTPIDSVVEKSLDHIDDLFERFIAASPFVVISSRGRSGTMDLSPKGDPAGFIKVLDRNTLVFPERPGNRRADTLHNILHNPSIGLIFLIPNMPDTLRVAGTAKIVQDRKLQQELAVDGKEPILLIAIDVHMAFMHCAKCMIRSKLWKPEQWQSVDGVPRLSDAVIKQLKLAKQEEQMVHDYLRKDQTDRLY
ncbi:MAG: MSMEG_1061 family FMN-dependent PPOX-type flavoprotein [Parasphingorhabdus sp.]